MASPPVYSTQFMEGVLSLASIDSPAYAPPEGQRMIVRDLAGWVANDGTDVGGILFFLEGNPIFYQLDVPPQCQLSYNWTGRLVIDHPNTLNVGVYGTAGDAHYVASGYLLSLP